MTGTFLYSRSLALAARCVEKAMALTTGGPCQLEKIVLIRSDLCAALGISSSLVVPPPYLVTMIREGYPPGFVVKF